MAYCQSSLSPPILVWKWLIKPVVWLIGYSNVILPTWFSTRTDSHAQTIVYSLDARNHTWLLKVFAFNFRLFCRRFPDIAGKITTTILSHKLAAVLFYLYSFKRAAIWLIQLWILQWNIYKSILWSFNTLMGSHISPLLYIVILTITSRQFFEFLFLLF